LIIQKGDLLGFVDESSQNINSNTQRLWSFGELKVKKNTIHLKANTIGCFMLNGIDTISFPIRTKSEDFCEFLVEVRHNNPIGRICLLADNFATHKAKKVREKADELNIILIYLPPYSPDLNPIEYLWKSIKRIISISEIDTKEELIKTARDGFFSLTASLSAARMWIPRFLYDKLDLLC
jgi:putative transposase